MRAVEDEFAEIRARLKNWGRCQWRELMRDAPDRSCVNTIYDMGRADADGHGEVTEDTERAEQTIETKGEQLPIDEDDAEAMHMIVKQTPKTAQHTLWEAFVYRHRVQGLGSALRAVIAVQEANRECVAKMRRMGA